MGRRRADQAGSRENRRAAAHVVSPKRRRFLPRRVAQSWRPCQKPVEQLGRKGRGGSRTSPCCLPSPPPDSTYVHRDTPIPHLGWLTAARGSGGLEGQGVSPEPVTFARLHCGRSRAGERQPPLAGALPKDIPRRTRAKRRVTGSLAPVVRPRTTRRSSRQASRQHRPSRPPPPPQRPLALLYRGRSGHQAPTPMSAQETCRDPHRSRSEACTWARATAG